MSSRQKILLKAIILGDSGYVDPNQPARLALLNRLSLLSAEYLREVRIYDDEYIE